MPDDACSDVKSDLQAGSYTHYTTSFPIYIEDDDDFNGGNVYIMLKDANRFPTQTVSGSVLFRKRSCTIEIVANTKTNRDNLYTDIENILTSTSRGYVLRRGQDRPKYKGYYSLSIMVEMLL